MTTIGSAVLDFWFNELDDATLCKDPASMRPSASATLQATILDEWRLAAGAGRPGEIIVLDQFSFNVWRDTPRASAGRRRCTWRRNAPPGPLSPAQQAAALRRSPLIHEHAVALFSRRGWKQLASSIRPSSSVSVATHRNAILGRVSREESPSGRPGSSF
jgi:uncharacterized protein (DUF924 family)